MKIYFCLFLTLILTTAKVFSEPPKANSKLLEAGKTAVIPTHKILPKDTLDRFLKNYGKDSLVKLIDSSIRKGSRVIEIYEGNLKNQSLANEIKQVSKQFSLGFDTLPFLSAPLDFPVLKMYNRYYGQNADIIRLNYITDSVLANTEMDALMSFYYDSIHLTTLQNFMLLYCDKMQIDDKIFDTLYSLKKNYPTKQKIETYFYFTEISRSCPGKYHLADSIKNVLFKLLNDKLKLSELLKDDYATLSNKNDFSLNLHYPLKFLAYSLYAKDYNIKANQADIFHILNLQGKDTGGWKEYNYESDILYYPSTFYAIWTLCELRQRIIDYK